MKSYPLFVKIVLLCSLLALSGCGDSSEDLTTNPDQPSAGRVAHQNWNSYNLYRFAEGAWTPVVTQGATVADLPALGDRPTIILHGLGSDIASGRFNALATSLVQSGATAIFGFEYDSLDSVAKNGNIFLEAMTLLTERNPGTTWRIAGHSMGTLVARVALESGIPLNVAPTGNRAVLVAGPHTGSEVVEKLQDRPDLIGEALGKLILNGRLEFRNADGQLVAVNGQEQGFTDLRRNSQFLNTLNFEASNHHPQFEYRTVAGNFRGDDYEALNRVLGVYADDGLVNVDSATAPVIGAVNSVVIRYDHSAIVETTDGVFAIVSSLGF